MHILRNAYTAQTVYHTTKSTVCIKTVFKISNTLFSTFFRCVFTECTREEVEEFRRGGFHKQEPSEKEERDEEAGARGTLPKRL